MAERETDLELSPGRRRFLRLAILLVAGLGAERLWARAATPGKGVETRYTAEVRRVTKALTVRAGRWKYLIIHHSGTRHGNAVSFDREHRRRGMENGLAYHFVIGNGVDSRDGGIEIGNRWRRQLPGGHVRSEQLNAVSIGICLVGDFSRTRPTGRQMAALYELLRYLRNEAVKGKIKIVTHREAHPKHTDCPGRYFPASALKRAFGSG